MQNTRKNTWENTWENSRENTEKILEKILDIRENTTKTRENKHKTKFGIF